jgi:hypothetical protein
VGLPGKRGADTNENRNNKPGKGAEYSPANRRPVAHDMIVLEAGGERRTDRRLHGPYTNALIGSTVQNTRTPARRIFFGCQPLLLYESWALRVIHWYLHRAVLPGYLLMEEVIMV